MKKLCLSTLTFVLIAGCVSQSYTRNEQIMKSAVELMLNCLKLQSNFGRKAECANNFYANLSNVSDDDYGKLPALRFATALYALIVKVDRRQINETDLNYQYMQISNYFQTDIENAKRRNISENRAAAYQQQQLFMNAQRLLSPPGSTINCYRPPGSYVTTCY